MLLYSHPEVSDQENAVPADEPDDVGPPEVGRSDRWPGFARRNAFVAAHLLLGLVLLSPIFIEPDSVGTYAWLRSAVFDGDLLFFNEWAAFGLVTDGYVRYKEVTGLSTLANHWGIGTSLLSSPVYLGLRAIAGLLGAPARAAGLFGIYGIGLALTSVLFVAATLVLLDAVLLERGASRLQRFATIAAVWLGTPLFWYEYRFPLGTHAAGALCVGVVCWLIARKRELLGWEIVALGLAFGLAVATRIQHVTLLPGIVYVLAVSRRPFRSIGLMAAGSAPPLVVQALAWLVVYGAPAGPVTQGANLAGGTWAPLQRITFDSVLLSSYHGLLSWSPVLILSLAGWWMARRTERVVVVAFVLMFLCELVANATMDRYFWGGLAFGARRFVDLALPFGFGIWCFVRAVPRRVAYPALIVSAGWSLSLTGSAIAGDLELLHDVSWPELAGAALDPRWVFTLDLSTLNSPIAFPASIPSALAAIGLILAIWSLILVAGRRPRGLFAACVILVVIGGGFILTTLAPTRREAPKALERFGIDRERASRAGPLLDQRALLLDELDYYRRTGRETSARKTIEELRAIDRELAAEGLPQRSRG